MAERIDHVAAALASRQHAAQTSDTANRAARLADAQVHAMLALVEQQRIANVISLMQMQAECDENTQLLAVEATHGLIEYVRTPATAIAHPEDVATIRPEIREVLGL